MLKLDVNAVDVELQPMILSMLLIFCYVIGHIHNHLAIRQSAKII